MDVLDGDVQDVVVQHDLRRRGACRERGVRRRGCRVDGRVLVLLQCGVRVHVHGRGGRGLVQCDVRGRGEVVLCGGVRRRERG